MKQKKIWSSLNRDKDFKIAQSKIFDIIIVGGGITGAGVAREASLRGLSFCLLDKADFAFGTSSRSSKLVHGGIRYLSNKEFRLVRESTTERNWLRNHFPNLITPQGFMFCSYEHGEDRPFHIIAALKMYDFLSDTFSKFKNYRKARFFSPKFVEEFEPAITQYDTKIGKMIMAGFYYDTNVDDSRLTVETIKDSLKHSNNDSVAMNYVKVTDYLKDKNKKVFGVNVTDQFTNNSYSIKGNVVVACCGIWTDDMLKLAKSNKSKIFPTKGVHIVVPNERIGNQNAFGIRSFDDGRFFFVLKKGKYSIIGTTDTNYFKESKDLDSPFCTKKDCDYLLSTVNRLFGYAKLSYKDIIGTYAGIRPLIKQNDKSNESAVSREHEIFEIQPGVVAIAGGKLTTFRLMAEQLIFYLKKKKYIKNFDKPNFNNKGFNNKDFNSKGFSKLPFAVGITKNDFYNIIKKDKLDNLVLPDALEHIFHQYGKQGFDILKNIKSKPELGTPLMEGYPYCEAEIKFILEHENAPRLIDILCRRTEASFTIWHYKQDTLAQIVADIMAKYYKWSEQQKLKEIKFYNDYIEKTVSFITKDE